jgi:CheY-like chemotaxis protein/two-component sensor histidine kinase
VRVMVVDDDDEHREALSVLLESRGHEVQLHPGASHALTALRQGSLPDIILLDLMMPNMDGWEFRLVQKREPQWANVPVIAMSGLNSPQAAAMDADAFLQKPIDEQTLLRTIDRVVAARARQHELARAGELERLVSLGALLGGISHEINNPLAIALGGIDLARMKLGRLVERISAQDEEAALASSLRALDSAREGTQRVNAVVRSASLFATADLERIDDIDVREVLESSLQIVSNEIRHAAHLVRELNDVPPVRGNPARLGQVFLNLLLNAIAAIRESGQREHLLRVGLSQSGEHVVISVSDTAAVHDHQDGSLFDPLHPTVHSVSRLRFGLAVSHELVQDMGGRIETERNHPRGALYRVWLPAHRAAAGRADASSSPNGPSQSRGVLVIDDEPLMCSLLKTMLSDRYEVTTFTSARAGLADLLQRDYRVILCDMMMPELSGDELFEQAVRVRPALRDRFVFITGGAFTQRAQQFLKQSGCPVLYKPCSRVELLATIAKVAAAPDQVETA